MSQQALNKVQQTITMISVCSGTRHANYIDLTQHFRPDRAQQPLAPKAQ